MTEGVRRTADFRRILELPRRVGAAPDLAATMTELLRRPGGTMTLRPAQAQALYEIAIHGGGFLSLDVGVGKTIPSLLAPWVLNAKRTLLLLPAGLIDKTNRDRAALTPHWLIPNTIRLFSYEMLGRKQSASELATFNPDLIVADEVQKLKNPDAACTSRVIRYMAEHPWTRFVGLSGTVMTKGLRDFAHILAWCLKDGAPVPLVEHELDEWAAALDKDVDFLQRYEPGALLELYDPAQDGADPDPVVQARRGFRRRLVQTPGVVASTEGSGVAQSIYLSSIEYPLKPETVSHFEKLRGEMLTPDDWQLFQPVDVWRHARELALGFHYVWDPRPPDDWRKARKEWGAFVRYVLGYSGELDSESQVAEACTTGTVVAIGGERRLVTLPRGRPILEAWLHERNRPREDGSPYKPNTVPVWHDDGALRACVEWMKRPGLVWTEHSFFARRLAQLAGTKYYGRKGLAPDGEFIDDAPNDRAIVVSIDANREGRNLQGKWSRNLVVSPPDGADVWQQMLGRTHRPGQTADEVTVDVLCGCLEHLNAMRKALAGARAICDTTGAEQKILLADIDWPDAAAEARLTGPRWRPVKAKPFEIPGLAA